MAKTKKTILIVNRQVSLEALQKIANDFRGDYDICMTGYGIEIWEKDLITGEMNLIRADNEKEEVEEESEPETLTGITTTSTEVKEDSVPEEIESEPEAEEVEEGSSIPEPKPIQRKKKVLSDRAEKIVKENYKTNLDKELVEIINRTMGESYTSDQVKYGRMKLGLMKQKIRPESSGAKKKYLEEHFTWLKDNINSTKDSEELVFLFNKEFGFNISRSAIKNVISTNGIKRNKTKTPTSERVDYMKRGGGFPYQEYHFDFLRANIELHRNKELVEIFNAKFDSHVTLASLTNIMSKNGIKRKPKGTKTKEKLEEPKHQTPSKIKQGEKLPENVIEFILINYKDLNDFQLRNKINDEFGVFYSVDKINEVLEKRGLLDEYGNPLKEEDDGYDMSEDEEDT